jgi:hypothetical protein
MNEAAIVSALKVAGVALGATLVMDLWNVVLKRMLGVPSLNFCLLGRWIRHMSSGTFWHPSITAASRKSFECEVGWSAHYLIGLSMGSAFVLAAGDWLLHPTVLPALAFGVATVVFPYFMLQPALGLGIASARTANPLAARLKSLMTHAVFGVGLYLAAQALAWVSRLGA